MKRLEKMLNPLRRNGSGQGALAIVLLLMLIGSVIIVPLLVFMQTGLKAGTVYESKMGAFYAADAGVEDALWRIKNDQVDLDPFNASESYNYSLPEPINRENVTVNITNIWIPLPAAPDAANASRIVEEGRLIVTGSLNGTTGYQIKMVYAYDNTSNSSPYYDPNGSKLMVEKIGVWLSGGFRVVNNTGSMAKYDAIADVSPHCGGVAAVWVNKTAFKNLPGGPSTNYSLTRTLNFTYTGPEKQAPSALAWVETSGVSVAWERDFNLSWDADLKPYRITSTAANTTAEIVSTAGNTTAEAYAIKTKLRKLGSATEGDYFAIGNSVVGYSKDDKYRDRLYEGSSATVATEADGVPGIPPGATIEAAYLYWTGWIDFRYWVCTGYFWGRCYAGEDLVTIPELKYSYDTTPDKRILVNQSARVDKVLFGVGSNMTTVTADKWQVLNATIDPEFYDSWSYCCIADVTDQIKGLIAAEEIESNAAGTYTLRHATAGQYRTDNYSVYNFTFYDTGVNTSYPLGTPALSTSGLRYQYSHGGWSLVIIYTSPETKGRQLFLYDIKTSDSVFSLAWKPGGVPNPDFDDDGKGGGNITGFLVPDPIANETVAAKITVFVGEGDNFITGDQIKVNGRALSNSVSPSNNVWNSRSPGMTVPGIDIDTFYIYWSDGIINPGDTSAQVDLPTEDDGFNLVYIILSFRSEIITGGTINYLIR